MMTRDHKKYCALLIYSPAMNTLSMQLGLYITHFCWTPQCNEDLSVILQPLDVSSLLDSRSTACSYECHQREVFILFLYYFIILEVSLMESNVLSVSRLVVVDPCYLFDGLLANTKMILVSCLFAALFGHLLVRCTLTDKSNRTI